MTKCSMILMKIKTKKNTFKQLIISPSFDVEMACIGLEIIVYQSWGLVGEWPNGPSDQPW